MITRDQALKIIDEKKTLPNIKKHMLAVEAIMRALARKFAKDMEEEWGLAGLLHDADYSSDVPENLQGIQVSQYLAERGFEVSEEIKHAMAAHNHATGVTPKSLMDWSLFCIDPLSGLIVATTLVMPDKKLASVKPESVLKKFKDPSFARGTRREDLKMCEEKLGIPLAEFIKIGLETMQKISQELGL